MTTQPDYSRYAVSTWSLHRTLGRPAFTGPETVTGTQAEIHSDALPLLELPSRLKEFGIHKVEICHFHLPTRDTTYLTKLRNALEESGITLWQFPDRRRRYHPPGARRA